MRWSKTTIFTEQETEVEAQSPVIISASRSTDIPAFYADWFIERLNKGYLSWKNPFNGVSLFVSFRNTRVIVFWSKNPKPVIKHLNYLDENKINYYFQFTLNDYDKEKIEGNIPNLSSRIETFIELSEKTGKEKIIWRFDPYILTDRVGVDELLRKTENIGNQLNKYTEKMVFSFLDIKKYKKVQNNLQKNKIRCTEFNEHTMNELAKGIIGLNEKWKLDIATCAEEIDLEQYGILHNKCIDDDLMRRLFCNDNQLMDFIGKRKSSQLNWCNQKETVRTSKIKDKGQRHACGCIMSKDIGQYNTCPHGCIYCYANTSKKIALKNYRIHRKNPNSETITGL